MNEDKKLISAIVIVAIAIFLVSGGTLAYWQWTTSELQGTLVNGSPAGNLNDTKMYIDFPENELTNLYPTSDCEANGTSSWVTEITIDNKTGVLVAPNFKLKVKIEDKNGNVITNVTNTGNSQPNRYYIKYAVTAENESCQNALATGRFDQNTQTVSGRSTWYDSGLITEEGTDGFPLVSGKIGSGVSFHAKANGETTQRFRVYAWLSSEYTSVNVGTEVTDTMQDAKVTVSWSENSNLEQVKKTKTGTAYAVYSADDNSLRFYRSTTPITQGSTYNGRTVTNVYTGFETASYNYYEAPWYENNDLITSIIFEDYIYPISTANWFAELYTLEYIDVVKLDTSNVTNMSNMFSLSLGDIIGLENFDTSNVTNMSWMFSSIQETDLRGIENWDVSNVTDMSHMFSYKELESLDLSSWDVSKLSIVGGMFYSSKINGNLNLSNWSSNVMNEGIYTEYSIFESTKVNGDLIIKNWNMTKLSSIAYLFSSTSVSGNLDLGGWNTSNITNTNSMFSGAKIANIINFDSWDVSNVTNMEGMFYSASVNDLDLRSWNVCNVVNYSDFSTNASGAIGKPYFGDSSRCSGDNVSPSYNLDSGEAFAIYSANEQALNFYRANESIVIYDTYNGKTVTELYTDFETETYTYNTIPWGEYAHTDGGIYYVTFNSEIRPISTAYWFSMGSNPTIEGISEYLNTSNTTNMEGMFYGWGAYSMFAQTVNLSNMDTSKVTNMSKMFSNCLDTISVKGMDIWDTSKVTDMSNMFKNTYIRSLMSIESWDVSNVTNMSGMLQDAETLEENSIDLSGWNVCKVTNNSNFATDYTGVLTLPNWGMSCP